jgi:AP2 domain
MTSQNESYRIIKLTQGQVAVVDAVDYDWLSQWKWYAVWDEDVQSFYAVRNSERTKAGKQRPIKMSRFILGLTFGDKRQADHWNRDTLNNRRSNLRISEPHQNASNRKINRRNSSGYKGITWCKTTSRWAARIGFKRTRIHLGYFTTKELAAQAYIKAARALHGEYARLT